MAETPTATTPSKKGGFLKIAGIGCGGLLAILIALAVIFGPSKEERAEQKHRDDSIAALQPKPVEDTVALTTTTPTEQKRGAGIGKSREEIMSEFDSPELAFNFKKGTDIDGQDNYVASSDKYQGSMIQLIGPSDELSSASITVGVTTSNAFNMQQLILLDGFATKFDSRAVDWITETVKERSSEGKFDESTNYGERKFRLQFIPMDAESAFLTLSINPLE